LSFELYRFYCADSDITCLKAVVAPVPAAENSPLIHSISAQGALSEETKRQSLNERQRKVINRVPDGFEGKLTSSKWAALTKSSPDTALLDINNLVGRGMLVRSPGGGRSTSYSLAKVEGGNSQDDVPE
jgi:Fic family protein